MHVLEVQHLNALLEALQRRNYSVIGPTIRDGAIVLDVIRSTENLPRGWTDEQGPAQYALVKRDDDAFFGYVVGPFAWKRFLYPPRLCLFAAKKNGKSFDVLGPSQDGTPRYAFLGVRSCELHAIALQDKVFHTGRYADQHYAALRRDAFIVAVNCVESRETCFCVSMKTGPRAEGGFDLALTEIIGEGHHYFLVQTGSARGESLLADLPHRQAEQEDLERGEMSIAAAARTVGRSLNTDGLPQTLNDNFEHPQWDDVAKRCLSCANCTIVCPTCFCSTVEDLTDLTGESAERWRRWDSCFTSDFTKIAGGNIRMSTRTRYRQWMMHKLAHWVDQFGAFGCVGCGRCITWCPAAIDITVEARAIQDTTLAVKAG
jgi:ferredoxin